MFQIVTLVLIFPLIGLLINATFSRWLDETWIGIVASCATGAAFVISILQAVTLARNHFHAETVLLAEWITIANLQLPWQMRVDTLSVTMMLLVTGVGTLIHIYAIGYMHGDPRFGRFFIYLNLFISIHNYLLFHNKIILFF